MENIFGQWISENLKPIFTKVEN